MSRVAIAMRILPTTGLLSLGRQIGTELSVFLPFSHVPVQRALMVIRTVGARRAQMLDNAAGPLLASGAGVAQLPQFLTE